jgi:hypothetical protein
MKEQLFQLASLLKKAASLYNNRMYVTAYVTVLHIVEYHNNKEERLKYEQFYFELSQLSPNDDILAWSYEHMMQCIIGHELVQEAEGEIIVKM